MKLGMLLAASIAFVGCSETEQDVLHRLQATAGMPKCSGARPTLLMQRTIGLQDSLSFYRVTAPPACLDSWRGRLAADANYHCDEMSCTRSKGRSEDEWATISFAKESALVKFTKV